MPLSWLRSPLDWILPVHFRSLFHVGFVTSSDTNCPFSVRNTGFRCQVVAQGWTDVSLVLTSVCLTLSTHGSTAAVDREHQQARFPPEMPAAVLPPHLSRGPSLSPCRGCPEAWHPETHLAQQLCNQRGQSPGVPAISHAL